MKRLTQTLVLCLLTTFPVLAQSNYVSEVWVSDLGNGKYKNPVLYADYSDPDACRVGDDFYMTSSSFGCLPGLQILHSKDLVNWTFIGAAVPDALAPIQTPERPEHGNRIWAPSIRHHNGEFYIFWGDPDQGAFMVKAKDPKGPWSEPVLVKAGKGIIDTCPLWDEDGKVYLVHAYAGSRAGLKSVITICELNAEATKAITPSRIVFDGHEAHQTCEGPKFYKRNGYYYIFHPAGGVPTGWQVVLRSKNVYGPYKEDGSVASTKDGSWTGTNQNPVDWMQNNPVSYKKYKVLSTLYAEVSPVRGLTIKSQFAADYAHMTAFSQSFHSFSTNNNSGTAGRSSNDRLSLTITNTANYHFTLKEKHDFNFLLGQEGVDAQ